MAAPRRPDPGPALAGGAFPRRRRRHQLPPLLQHQRSRRPAHGAARRLRPYPPARLPADGRGHRRRLAHRPCRRSARPRRLPSPAARQGAPRRLLSGRREDPGAPREPARGMACRRHDRLRLHQSGDRAPHRPGGRGRLRRDLRRLRRRSAVVCRDRARIEVAHHGKRDGERAQRARPRRRAGGAPEPAHRRFHPQHPQPGAEGGDRLLPGLPHLSRRRRGADRGGPARPRLGGGAGARSATRTSTTAPSNSSTSSSRAISSPSRAAASAAMRRCAPP